MWEYIKLRNGYVRSVDRYGADRFMFDTLCNSVNRTWWNRLIENTICKVLCHKKSCVIVEKGYTNRVGSFEIVMCDRCRVGVIYYEKEKP